MTIVASVQAASVAYDTPATLVKLHKLTAEAKALGAELVQFPEAFVGGYPRFLDFRIGTRTAENREWYAKYVEVG